jgi:hypothetical protein
VCHRAGGIVVLSSHALTGGGDPEFDAIVGNRAFRNRPADLIWDGSGTHIRFRHNHCGTSAPAGHPHLPALPGPRRIAIPHPALARHPAVSWHPPSAWRRISAVAA